MEGKLKIIILFFVFLSLISPVSAFTTTGIPHQENWNNVGPMISEGPEGSWDRYLWGGFANSLVKKNNTFYFYYQGSQYYDDACDSVAERSIGLATSTDGIHWTKHPNNPVITWQTSGGSIEEGAASSGALVGSDGKIYVYYGANSGSGCTVNANARLSVSTDGVNFQDSGEVLSRLNPTVWGSGDEMFPVGAFEYSGKWNMFYIPNGVALSRKLGVAIGGLPTAFTTTAGVNNSTITAWGPVSSVIMPNTGALFVNANTAGPVQVYTFNPTTPSSITLSHHYQFSDCTQPSVLYDAATATWLMACRNSNASAYTLKTARQQTSTSTPTPTSNTKPGDANGDGKVDGLDYIVWLLHYGQNVSGVSNGDFNTNGTVDGLDYIIWLNNYGR